MTEFRIVDAIGSGVQAEALLACVTIDATEKLFVIKNVNARSLASIHLETQALERLDGCEHVIQLCRDIVVPKEISASSTILLQYCPGGELFDYIKVFSLIILILKLTILTGNLYYFPVGIRPQRVIV